MVVAKSQKEENSEPAWYIHATLSVASLFLKSCTAYVKSSKLELNKENVSKCLHPTSRANLQGLFGPQRRNVVSYNCSERCSDIEKSTKEVVPTWPHLHLCWKHWKITSAPFVLEDVIHSDRLISKVWLPYVVRRHNENYEKTLLGSHGLSCSLSALHWARCLRSS